MINVEGRRYMMTVIMPSYNNGKYIEQAIQSVLEQEIDFSIQLIITDDASTDNSVSIIKEYEKKYPDVISGIFSDKNEGLFDNYYKAVEKMNSKYFCVLDPDDYYTDTKRLQKAVDFLELHDEYTIHAFNATAIKEDTDEVIKKYYFDMPLGETHVSTLEDFVMGKAFLCNTPGSTFRNVAYSREMISKIKGICRRGFYDKAAFRADMGRNVVHLTKGKSFFVNEYVAQYRIHEHNISQNVKEYEKYLSLANSFILYDKFFDGKYTQNLYKSIYEFYRNAIINYYNELCVADTPSKANESIKKLYEKVSDWLDLHKQYKEHQEILYYNISYLADLAHRKVICWGTGKAAERMLDKYHISLKEIDFFINGTLESGQTSTFCDKEVYSSKDILLDEDCYVIICSSFYRDILEYIEQNNLYDVKKIINLYAYDQNYGRFLN